MGAEPPPTPAPETGSQQPQRRIRRTAIITFGSVMLITALLIGADVGTAIQGEHRLSTALTASPRVEFQPEVTLDGGVPYFASARAGRFDGATLVARGVPLPADGTGCSLHGCRADLAAEVGPFTTTDGWRIGPDTPVATASLRVTTRLDSVNLGRMLDVLDLYITTPAPAGVAGAGGPGDGLLERSSGVVLTGTVALPDLSDIEATDRNAGDPQAVLDAVRADPAADSDVPASADAYDGAAARVSVSVDISVDEAGRVHIQATDLYTGPQEHASAPEVENDMLLRAAVLERFTRTLPPLPMPFGLPTATAYGQGSDLVLATVTGAMVVHPREF